MGKRRLSVALLALVAVLAGCQAADMAQESAGRAGGGSGR